MVVTSPHFQVWVNHFPQWQNRPDTKVHTHKRARARDVAHCHLAISPSMCIYHIKANSEESHLKKNMHISTDLHTASLYFVEDYG
jgi:hypothetical protein